MNTETTSQPIKFVEVLRREAKLGDAVIIYDEGGNWRGVAFPSRR